MQTKRTGSTKDDERDDAFGANKMAECDRWDCDLKGNIPIHEIEVEGPSSRHHRDTYFAGTPTENRRHYNPANWYTRHTPTSARSAYRMADEQTRHSIGMVPISNDDLVPSMPSHHTSAYSHPRSVASYSRANTTAWPHVGYDSSHFTRTRSSRGGRQPSVNHHISRVIIPKSLVIPRAISSPSVDGSYSTDGVGKRSRECRSSSPSPSAPKRAKTDGKPDAGTFEMLDLLCSATLELGPLQENPTGCSCPKSKCIALYCDCFKAGRRCNPTTCTCIDCKNTVEESGINGARSKAIQGILARNPRAFTSAGNKEMNKVPAGVEACNCIRSRCLKLYCICFQSGKTCNPSICSCVGCLNTENDTSGMRKAAIEMTLEKRPDAFKSKPKKKEIGSGCACKNNRCIRKYCECFRTGLLCTKKCCCRDCENQASSDVSV